MTNAGLAFTALTVALIAAATPVVDHKRYAWGLILALWSFIVAVVHALANHVGLIGGLGSHGVGGFDPLADINFGAVQFLSAEQFRSLALHNPYAITAVSVVFLSAAGCATLIMTLTRRLLRFSRTLAVWIGALAAALLATVAMEETYLLFLGSLPLLVLVHSGIFCITVAIATAVAAPTSSPTSSES